MKKIFAAIIVFLLFAGMLSAGDTGTYRIQDYRVKITPHSDGAVEIEYFQKWLVTGGHIPWITVGLPNSDFEITGKGAAAKQIRPANEGGWSGVRIDLDKDYKPGESFEVNFSVTEHKLFFADNGVYRLKFIPGWYDRAVTEHLAIEVVCFAKIEQVTVSPEPTSKTDNSLVWEKGNLGAGEKFEISVSFPKNLVSLSADERKPKLLSSEDSGINLFIDFLVIALMFGLIIAAIRRIWRGSSGIPWGYSGGTYHGSGGMSAGGGRNSSGGGGFGGRSFSCACACVSCACACACAGGGGGGAGCSRKFQHFCRRCKMRRRAKRISNFFQRRVKC